jgi:hypothetical protein
VTESFFQIFNMVDGYFPEILVISNLPKQNRHFNFVNTRWFWSVYIFQYQRAASSGILGKKDQNQRTTSSSYFINLKEFIVLTKELIKNLQFCWQSFDNFNF